jgi:hypothetical protein
VSHEVLPNGATFVRLAGATHSTVAAASQNFLLQWLEGADASTSFSSHEETIVILASGTAWLSGGAWNVSMTGPAVAIVPAGRSELTLENGTAVVLATERSDLDKTHALNAPLQEDGRVAAVGSAMTRAEPLAAAEVINVVDLLPPPDNGRLRFLQSATMSINFVLYDGPRGSDALSPHAHTDIEQGTLALAGDYVHHLRTPWGRSAADWRDDVHLPAGPGTLLLIPPELVHTTEGVGTGQHMLIDIFAPPRRDFIAKGWMANAADYAETGA